MAYGRNYKDSNAYKMSLKKTSEVFKDGQQVTVRGMFVSSRYQGDNDFVIATLDVANARDNRTQETLELPKEKDEELVCKGRIIQYNEGGSFELTGSIVDDQTYGIQLNVRQSSPIQPSSKNAMRAFLANAISGCGAATAARITDALGEDTYEILAKHPERLGDIPVKGVSQKRLQGIAEQVSKKTFEMEQVAFLSEFGLSQARCQSIIAAYHDDTINVIKRNPYALTKVKGFAFTSVDAIARGKFGIAMDDPRRLDAGIVATLRWACSTYGHTIVPLKTIYDIAVQKLGFQDEQKVRKLLQEAKAHCVQIGSVMETKDGLQLPNMAKSEAIIKRSIGDMLNTSRPLAKKSDVDSAIKACQPLMGFELTDEQLSATRMVFSEGLTLLTAGAGAGKSTAIKMVVQVAKRLDIPYILCSPTGKAAKRLSEACTMDGDKPLPAYTLHRALGIGRDVDDTGDANADVHLASVEQTKAFTEARLVLCDEVSMLDTNLAARLFKHCKGKHVLLIGDQNQLPSVGPGAVLHDMLACPDIPQVRLHHIFRQAEGSPIIMAANAVLNGQNPCDVPGIEFHECLDDDVLATIDRFVIPRINDERLTVKDIAFMSPMKKRTATSGTEALNRHLRPILNKRFHDDGNGNAKYQVGDFITQTKNDYDVNHFNGDQGTVTAVDNKHVTISFFDDDDEEVVYSHSEAQDETMLAYASTIHRYQGSQCDTVVLVMTDSHYIMCNRNLLYTGITRAAKRLILIGNETAFKRAAKNAKVMNRNTGLQDMRFPRQTRMR